MFTIRFFSCFSHCTTGGDSAFDSKLMGSRDAKNIMYFPSKLIDGPADSDIRHETIVSPLSEVHERNTSKGNLSELPVQQLTKNPTKSSSSVALPIMYMDIRPSLKKRRSLRSWPSAVIHQEGISGKASPIQNSPRLRTRHDSFLNATKNSQGHQGTSAAANRTTPSTNTSNATTSPEFNVVMTTGTMQGSLLVASSEAGILSTPTIQHKAMPTVTKKEIGLQANDLGGNLVASRDNKWQQEGNVLVPNLTTNGSDMVSIGLNMQHNASLTHLHGKNYSFPYQNVQGYPKMGCADVRY